MSVTVSLQSVASAYIDPMLLMRYINKTRPYDNWGIYSDNYLTVITT